MCKSLIRLCHAMYVVLLLDRAAAHVRGLVQLIGQLLWHSLFSPSSGVLKNPANRQAGAPGLAYFDGHLVVGAAYAPRFYFKQRLAVFNRFLEKLERFVTGALADLFHRLIKNPLRGVLLAVPHHR